jgi:hypothetical protein
LAKSETVSQLQRLVSQLKSERQTHVAAIEEIDRTFTELGMGVTAAPASAAPAPRRGRPPKSASPVKTGGGSKRGRGRFPISGEESILNFVRQAGNPTTAEINVHWHGEGRKGKADNTITKLVQEKKLKRQKIKGERGSRFRV